MAAEPYDRHTIPDILQLRHASKEQELQDLLTRHFDVTAAIGPRSTAAASEVVTRIYYGDLLKTIVFMNVPHAWLGGRTPLERAEESDEGLADVMDFIGAVEAGTYA